MIRKLFIGVCSLCTVLLLFAFGQSTGTLNGKITAPDGKPVPSASVTATDTSGQARSGISAQDGTFSINNLPPGSYHIDVEVPGFKRLSQENVQISAGTPVNLQLGLQVGSATETVRVEGQAPLADDRDSMMARGYSGNVLNQLPVFDRNHEQLVEMMTGIANINVAPSSGFVDRFEQPTGEPNTNQSAGTDYSSILSNPQASRDWNTNGQLWQANNKRLDGLENYDPALGLEMHVPTIGSIQQMNIATSNYRAEIGWAGGSSVNSLTRPGTNGIHGELFWFNATNGSQARNFFNPKGTKQSVLTSNKFGGHVGGPIIKNKTFVFLGYEGDYLRDHSPTFTTVPTGTLASGNFSAVPGLTLANPFTGLASGVGRSTFPNNIIPASLINPAAARVLSALPAPNEPGIEYNYFANVPVVNDGNRIDARLDQRFSDQDSAFFRYGLSYYNTDKYSAFGPLGSDSGSSRLRGDEAAAGWTRSFSPTTYMELRGGYNRYSDPIGQRTPALAASAFGLTGTSLPQVSIDTMMPFGTNPSYRQLNKEQTYELANDWHTRFFNQDLRFGVDAWWIRMDGFQNLLYGPAGGYTFSGGATMLPGAAIGPYGDYANSLAAFLLGTPTNSGITTSHYVPSYLRQQYGGYLADRVNIGSKITVDLGLRYDFFRQMQPRDNSSLYSIFNPATATLVPINGHSVDRYGNVGASTLNFAPRVGIAYRFNDRTVIRAGYAITYWDPSMLFASASLIPQSTSAEAGVAGSYATVGPFGTYPSTSATTPDRTYFFSPRTTMRTPYVQMYNVDVQRELPHGVVADLAYVGNVGRELPYTWDRNAAAPGTGVAGMPFAGFGLTSPIYERATGMNSNYNALQLNVTKRFSQGVSFAAAYTWSKSLDYGAGLQPFLNNLTPRANYGPSNFDQTNVLTITHNIRIPIGTGQRWLSNGLVGKIVGPWNLDGIFRYYTGLPFTPTASAAMCACPGNTPTALVTSQPNPGLGYVPSFFGYFADPFLITTNHFSQPPAGSLGNAGRNSLRTPNTTNYDLALTRSFVFVEQTRLEFRAEAYNLANSTHFAMPLTNVNSAGFGQAFSTLPGLGSRTLQFALKLSF